MKSHGKESVNKRVGKDGAAFIFAVLRSVQAKLAMPRSSAVRSSRSVRTTRYTESEIMRLKTLNFFDNLGILLICRPIFLLVNLELINILDDIGNSMLMRPLRYLYRFSEYIVQLTEDW